MKEKFLLLDGLRGLAAIAVVMYHADSAGRRTAVFSHGYLAVDFFFMLSGFIIAYNYQGRLDTAWSSKDFFKVRLIRLYPLYFLGLVTGAAGLLLKNHIAHTGTSPRSLVGVLALGALLLPIPQFLRGGTHGAFPLDFPAWSLFAEAVANIFHAFFFRHRSTLAIMGWFMISVFFTVFFTIRYHGLSFGFNSSEILLAIPRVLMSYTAGMMIHRLWVAKRMSLAMPGWIVCLLLMLTLLCRPLGSWNALYDLFMVILVFPALLFAGTSARVAVNSPLRHLYKYGGKTSYAIYVMRILDSGVLHPGGHRAWSFTTASIPALDRRGVSFVGACVATIVYEKYDEPVRSALGRLLPVTRPQRIQTNAESTL